jgi:DNA-binding transcriptional LysR family regulator
VPGDLLNHQCIALESQVSDGLWSLDTAEEGPAIVTPRMTASDIVVVREMVLAGLGCGILTHVLAETDVRAKRLVRVLPDWAIPPVLMSATFLERRHLPQRIRAFLDLIVQQIQRAEP